MLYNLMIPLFHNSLIIYLYYSMTQWLPDSVIEFFYHSLILLYYYSILLWSCDSIFLSPQFHNSETLQFYDSLILLFNYSIILWFYNCMGFLIHWFHEFITELLCLSECRFPCFYAAIFLWLPHSLIPLFFDVMILSLHSSMIPWVYDSIVYMFDCIMRDFNYSVMQ